MKKILFILIFALLLSINAFAKEFTDVDSSIETYKEAISYLSENGIINGYEDGSFKPANLITRAEIIKIIVVSFDIKFADGINKSYAYDDVKGKWFEEYVKIGASNGIIKLY